jgi:hypothetical protein
MTPDQASYLDALIPGMIILANRMHCMAYIGVHHNSGWSIHTLKHIIKTEYEAFATEFKVVKTREIMYLANAIMGCSYQESLESLDMAWGLQKASREGFNSDWERVYIELDEFKLFLGYMSVFHFGVLYPCFSQKELIPSDWWHLQLHLYISNPQVVHRKLLIGATQLRRQPKAYTWLWSQWPKTGLTWPVHHSSGVIC